MLQRTDAAAPAPSSGAGRRPTARGWEVFLPYLTIALVVLSDVLFGPGTNMGSYLVLAPLLASRLLDRRHVAMSGSAALLAEIGLGVYNGDTGDIQQVIRLTLIALGTLIALINQGVYQRERSALSRADSTIALAGSLLAGVEPEEAHALLARSARTLYDADVAVVYRYDGERMTLARADRSPSVPPMPTRFSATAFPAAFGPGQHMVHVGERDAPEATMLAARGLVSLLLLPLADRASDPVGTLALGWAHDPRLSDEELEASRRFAQLGTRAIIGSERARMQAEVLDRVLALLLTEPPKWARSYRIGVRYRAASELAQIGGDFFDVVEVGEEGLAFIIADTRGKGLEASSLAAVLKGAFRSLAGEGAGPGRILTRLGRLVSREGGEEDFVTALVGRLHADGRLTLASAGHPLPFGVAPELPEVGAPLGIGDSAPEGRIRLEPGDRFLCYTDGLVEARDPSGRFIDQEALMTALAAPTLDAVLDRLVSQVEAHVRGRFSDDLALLILQYDPRPDEPDGGRRGEG